MLCYDFNFRYRGSLKDRSRFSAKPHMARLQEFLIPLCSVASFIFSGDTLGSFVYVPCEVIKQRMQIQGTSSSWSSFISRNSVPVKPRGDMYGYYTGMFQAGSSILKEQGPKGLYAGYVNLL